jgi:hypothetical protein
LGFRIYDNVFYRILQFATGDEEGCSIAMAVGTSAVPLKFN